MNEYINLSLENIEDEHICCVIGDPKHQEGIGKELLEYAINDSKEKGKRGICTLVSKKKKPFLGEKNFFEHYGFKVVDVISDYAKEKNIKLNFVKIDSLEKAKNAPCIFNNWANFYKGEFISNTILNANALEKLLKIM